MAEPQLRIDIKNINKRFDILLSAFKSIAELQDDKNEKIKVIYDNAIKEIESIK